MVFVLDKHKKPLMPCTPKKAMRLSRQSGLVSPYKKERLLPPLHECQGYPQAEVV